jgi:putative heme-binding domain-containing protein
MPIYQLLRGAYYPSFGKPDDGLGYGPMMMKHQHHSSGIAGITWYAADHFPKEYYGNIFIGNVVTSRINHDKLKWDGSSPRAIEQPDFLVSRDPWFRPVDIKLGPDGALYVADFYNRIIGHYEVPLTHPGRDRFRGRIWRIIYSGKDGKNRPHMPRADWTKAGPAELVQDLGDPNLTVRMFATNQLVLRGDKESIQAVKAVMKPGSKAWQRVHGLWVLERTHSLDGDTLALAAKDKNEAVRVHACHVLSERGKLSAPEGAILLAGLKDTDANVRRAAADALGRHPETKHLQPLLDCLHATPGEDTHLRHVLRIALRNQLQAVKPWPEVKRLHPRDAGELASVMLGLHNADSAGFLLKYLEQDSRADGDRAAMLGHIARYGSPEVRKAMVARARDRWKNPAQAAHMLRSIEHGLAQASLPPGEGVRDWAGEIAPRLLKSKNTKEVVTGMSLVGSFRLMGQIKPVEQTLAKSNADPVKVAALDALAALDAPGHVALFGQILTGSHSLPVRQQCANLLGRLNTKEARAVLVKSLEHVPAAVQGVVAGSLTTAPEGAEALMQAVETGKASGRLLLERTVETRLRERRVKNLEVRLKKATAGLPPLNQAVAQLIKSRRDGFFKAKTDAALGQMVFEKHCAACHQVGGKGQRIGPQLDGIGVRGVERLLEDTLDPSRNVDQAFRTTVLNLKSGRTVTGLLLREEGETLVLADAAGKEVRVGRGEVEERLQSQLSPMPANFADQIPEADFRNLVAFLLTQKRAEK